MDLGDTLLFDGTAELGHYQVVDCIYSGRRARVLYSGHHRAAQSGIALDGGHDLLFDYNQRFMELVRGLNPKRLLLIGGGAYTLPRALIEEFPNMSLDIVEPDVGLLDIAKSYFGFKPTARTRIYHDDGRGFLESYATTYDMILIDAFTNTEIPPSLQTVEAAYRLKKHLRRHGVLAMNVIAAFHGARSDALRRIVAAHKVVFPDTAIFPASVSESLWVPQNFICTGSDTDHDLQAFVRYLAQPAPATSEADVATDEDL